jgi:hypothetical protein
MLCPMSRICPLTARPASSDKHPVNTAQPSRFVSKCSLAGLFGSNGNSNTISTQSDMCIYTHIIHNIFETGQAKEIKILESSDCRVQRKFFPCAILGKRAIVSSALL